MLETGIGEMLPRRLSRHSRIVTDGAELIAIGLKSLGAEPRRHRWHTVTQTCKSCTAGPKVKPEWIRGASVCRIARVVQTSFDVIDP